MAYTVKPDLRPEAGGRRHRPDPGPTSGGWSAAGILTEEDARILRAALDRVGEELVAGTFVFKEGDEDVHTAVERRVTELAGSVGAKLHSGRSRNDQVATDLRLFTKRELLGSARRTLALQKVLLDRAKAAGDAYLPGYTRTSSGRSRCCWPTTCWPTPGRWPATSTGSWTARRRLDVSPLGAGALAGSSLPLQPDLGGRF